MPNSIRNVVNRPFRTTETLKTFQSLVESKTNDSPTSAADNNEVHRSINTVSAIENIKKELIELTTKLEELKVSSRVQQENYENQTKEALTASLEYSLSGHLEQCDLLANVVMLSQGLEPEQQKTLLNNLQGAAILEASSIAERMHLDSTASELRELVGSIEEPSGDHAAL